jgi:lipid II:glycine glycyltransferase (peptidoglycan interpeptide bridge formation enzyme)
MFQTVPNKLDTQLQAQQVHHLSGPSSRPVIMNNSRYTFEVDNVSESQWSLVMDQFVDANIYQTWSYGSVRWGAKNLSHLILKRDEKLVGSAQLRIVRPLGLKAGVAYLRWGPMCHLLGLDLSEDTMHELARALWEEYARNRGLYLEILPNAFEGSVRAALFQSAFKKFSVTAGINTEKYRTFVLDLNCPLEELRKKLDKKWRNQLNAAERNNLALLEGEDEEHYNKFSDLYVQMWERKRFKTSVSIDEFGDIQKRLPARQRMRVFICEHEHLPIGGLVCSAMGESAIYLLGATNEVGMKLKVAYTLQWAVIRWLKDRGTRYYDLGGIDPVANPGVYHFKSGLSAPDVSHIGPLVACENSFSTAFVVAGQVLHQSLRKLRQKIDNK